MEFTIEDILKENPVVSELYNNFKPGKYKTVTFVKIYKNLNALWFSNEEINNYFDLKDDFADFVKSF